MNWGRKMKDRHKQRFTDQMKARILEAMLSIEGRCFFNKGGQTYLRFDSISFNPSTSKVKLYWNGKETYEVDVRYQYGDLTITGLEGQMAVDVVDV